MALPTLVMFAVIFGLGAAGVLLIRAALRDRGRACPQSECGIRNPGAARFCARCGAPLDGSTPSS